MSLDLFVCCEQAIVDVRSNRVTLFNVYDGIATPAFPATLGSITTVMSFSRAPAEPDRFDGFVRFSIDGEQIFEGPFSVDFEGASGTRVIAQLDGMIIPKPGRFEAVSIANDVEIGRYTFAVEQLDGNQPELI